MESSVNIPVGSHDVYSMDDVYIALSRLMASNVGVCKWVIRLNNDWNNESYVVLNAEKIPLIIKLREEQAQLAVEHESINTWFTRPVQLSARKRVINVLKKELSSRVHICRSDIYPTWEYYCRMIKQFGAVIEAEPIETLGVVEGICCVNPLGEVQGVKGVEVHINEHCQVQSYMYPQNITPKSALEGATKAICQKLFLNHGVIGYVSVRFTSFWDAHSNMPKLWATGVQFGMRSIFGALGTAAVAANPPPTQLPLSMMPDLRAGRHCIYIPMAVHDPLRSSHDDIFFKLCRMRGVAFDIQTRVGALFLLVDSIVSGAVSMICIANSRKKTIELAIYTLSFINREFGMDSITNPLRCEYLTPMLINMKKLLKQEKSTEIANMKSSAGPVL